MNTGQDEYRTGQMKDRTDRIEDVTDRRLDSCRTGRMLTNAAQ